MENTGFSASHIFCYCAMRMNLYKPGDRRDLKVLVTFNHFIIDVLATAAF